MVRGSDIVWPCYRGQRHSLEERMIESHQTPVSAVAEFAIDRPQLLEPFTRPVSLRM